MIVSVDQNSNPPPGESASDGTALGDLRWDCTHNPNALFSNSDIVKVFAALDSEIAARKQAETQLAAERERSEKMRLWIKAALNEGVSTNLLGWGANLIADTGTAKGE